MPVDQRPAKLRLGDISHVYEGADGEPLSKRADGSQTRPSKDATIDWFAKNVLVAGGHAIGPKLAARMLEILAPFPVQRNVSI